MSSCQGEWAGPQLARENPRQVPRRVAKPTGQAGHTLPLQRAVGDESHRARREIIVEIPFGRSGHGVGEAASAGAQSGVVCGSGRAEEDDILGLRDDCGAARPAVDACRGHPGDELAVEARIPRRHRPIACREGLIALANEGGLGCGGLSHVLTLSRSADIGQRFSDPTDRFRVERITLPETAQFVDAEHIDESERDLNPDAFGEGRLGGRRMQVPVVAVMSDESGERVRVAHHHVRLDDGSVADQGEEATEVFSRFDYFVEFSAVAVALDCVFTSATMKARATSVSGTKCNFDSLLTSIVASGCMDAGRRDKPCIRRCP